MASPNRQTIPYDLVQQAQAGSKVAWKKILDVCLAEFDRVAAARTKCTADAADAKSAFVCSLQQRVESAVDAIPLTHIRQRAVDRLTSAWRSRSQRERVVVNVGSTIMWLGSGSKPTLDAGSLSDVDADELQVPDELCDLGPDPVLRELLRAALESLAKSPARAKRDIGVAALHEALGTTPEEPLTGARKTSVRANKSNVVRAEVFRLLPVKPPELDRLVAEYGIASQAIGRVFDGYREYLTAVYVFGEDERTARKRFGIGIHAYRHAIHAYYIHCYVILHNKEVL